MKSSSPPGRDVLLTLGIAVAVLVFWNSRFIYPIRIFVVFFHELSHGLAAALTGGSIVRIELSAAEGGLCQIRGGSRFLVLNAGYLGSLLWGVVLLLLGSRSRLDRILVGLLGLMTLGVTLVYVRSLFGLVYGLLAAAALLGVARMLPASASDTLLRVIGTVSCLYAIWDIASDVLLRNIPCSDANALGRLTGIPGVVWGVVWVVVATVVTALTFRVALAPRK